MARSGRRSRSGKKPGTATQAGRTAAPVAVHATSGKKRRRGGGSRARPVTETSVPTGRAAYADTRKWLLKTHGPVCAYCGLTHPARELTLDHVTPRRGQSAFDRRDNLVLACKRCNAAKADKSFLAWVLGARSRATHLFMYGQHLSEGILELLRPMVGDVVLPSKPVAPTGPVVKRRSRARPRRTFGPDNGPSPYQEPSPYLDG